MLDDLAVFIQRRTASAGWDWLNIKSQNEVTVCLATANCLVGVAL